MGGWACHVGLSPFALPGGEGAPRPGCPFVVAGASPVVSRGLGLARCA